MPTQYVFFAIDDTLLVPNSETKRTSRPTDHLRYAQLTLDGYIHDVKLIYKNAITKILTALLAKNVKIGFIKSAVGSYDDYITFFEEQYAINLSECLFIEQLDQIIDIRGLSESPENTEITLVDDNLRNQPFCEKNNIKFIHATGFLPNSINWISMPHRPKSIQVSPSHLEALIQHFELDITLAEVLEEPEHPLSPKEILWAAKRRAIGETPIIDIALDAVNRQNETSGYSDPACRLWPCTIR